MPKANLPRNKAIQVYKRQNLTYEQKIEVINFYWKTNKLLNLVQMVEHLQEKGFRTIHPTTISRYVKDEASIRERAASSLDASSLDMVTRHRRISDYHICERARELCQAAGISEQDTLDFSRGWLARFKKRHGLKRIRFHGERASAPIENIAPEQARLQSIIAGYEPRNVLNVDETGHYWRIPPKSGIGDYDRGGLKDDKARLTYAFCVNLDGSEKRKPLVIGNAAKPHCFNGRTPAECGYDYYNNDTAWMRGDIWQKFLADLNKDMYRQGRHVLLICDNCRAHTHDNKNYSNLRIEFLAPNLTAYIQPLDAGVIASFKAHYWREFIKLAIRRDDAGITNIYKINQWQAMELANIAWDAVSSKTIANCWKHTGICPVSRLADSQYTPPEPEDPETVRKDLLHSIGLDSDRMRIDVHPDVYRMINALSQDPPTEEPLSDEQLLQSTRPHI
ncbi:Tigger transposable element-derived protein 6 [Rhizoctonia solani AG-1 IB]|uniref:Tigger transposable element-derived protein 6 n=1 Tax=Thanatephorus cucumeris (strain AG1-IB / isolate 7/3/14) TaxID=1108050 RepID=M5BXD8_THACB|nr:Tigger transposable element-derived protein 6 [Rhizoctonia solani AG-1 IB]